jgi:amino acid adenylation domain-containing protein
VSAPELSRDIAQSVAIIGMAGRFPGAANVSEFWRNQLNGVEAISRFQVEELEVPGAAELAKNPDYVRARSILENVDMFDAEFFGIYPKEAELMDPQHRIFLESCWQAFEDGGYDPLSYPGAVGVYAGCSMPTYFLSRLCPDRNFIERFTGGYQVGNYPEMMGNSLDFLSTRVSYKLGLRGPSMTLQTGCSTSLVAVCQACQSLLTFQSDMALAGGASITLPQKRGSFYQEGGMVSPDGHCRTFDADANGTVFGSGAAVVLLKRAEDAVRDGDHIYALIRGFALNNDGSAKVGYTAPSIEGQSRVIAMAQELAGVDPLSIGYIEAHGTATPLGDPIEVAALTQAFRAGTSEKHFCVLGTAKTNVGHLDVASGVTGLINAANIVRHGIFPPTLYFQKPNPKLNLENSPFYVNSKVADWKTESPRRAGVSAFGVGGTNAHLVIEQAPSQISDSPSRADQLIVLSARSENALEDATSNLVEHLRAHPDANLADVAWTLQAGRRHFDFRSAAVVHDAQDAIAVLSQRDRRRLPTRRSKDNSQTYFLFPGQGSQQPNMAREIYETEPVFRKAVDLCAEILRPHLNEDLRSILYPADTAAQANPSRITETMFAQPAIFTIEYALAQLWMHWGIRPQAMLGHSVGEFVAACLAEVFSLEDSLALIAARGRMMQKLPRGGMLSVRLPESELRSQLNSTLALAAVNSPALCVVAGPLEALNAFEDALKSKGVACRPLLTSHAFHSSAMDPILDQFASRVAQAKLRSPQIPFISGISGTWITAQQAMDPTYWARHLRATVQFSAGVVELKKNAAGILLEVGPGNALSTLARQHSPATNGHAADGSSSTDWTIVSSFADASSSTGRRFDLLKALGDVWLSGLKPNWQAIHGNERPRRVSLPTYPFERKRFWLEVPAQPATTNAVAHEQMPKIQNSLEETPQVNTNPQPPEPKQPSPALDRSIVISRMISEIFEDLSGTPITLTDAATSFLEMGFDSLFLTQVTQALQSKFGVKIVFRQLLSDQSTLESLTEFISAKSSFQFAPEAQPSAPEPVPVPQPSPNATPATPAPRAAEPLAIPADSNGNSHSAIERIMRDQLQAMNQLFAKQLESLGNAAAPPARPAAIAQTIDSPAKQSALQPVEQQTSAGKAPAQDEREFKPFGPYKPPQTGLAAELSEKQNKYLKSFIERFSKRTANSKRLTQEYRQHLADPRVVSGFRSQWKEIVYPILTDRSKGSRLWDVDGNEYIDILNGFGPIMLGHRPDFVEKAVAQQLQEGFEIGPQSPLAGEVAKMFCEMTGNERMTFCNTGSEAVIAAIRVARTVTARSKVVLFAGSYHGMFDEVLVKGVKAAGTPRSLPIAPGIPRESVGNIVVLDYGTPESLEWIRTHANELAAVLVEPVQSRHPNLQPREFVQQIRKITEDSGSALIFDEVVTGFRVHPGGCQALFGIRADLATYGKVLGGGMPIGILAGKAKFMDALDGGVWQFGDDSSPSVGVTFFAGTFVRHPLTLAAVKSVLNYFKQQGPQLQEQLTARTGSLVRSVNALFEKYQLPTRIENFASIFYFGVPSDLPFASLLYYHLREKGVYILEGFPCFLTTAHSDADIQTIIRVFDESLAEMQAGGLLPSGTEPPKLTAPAPQASEGIPPAKTSTPQEVPLTEAQLEIWLSAQLGEEASRAYNESFTLQLRGPLDEQALVQSLQDLVNRHDALRATIVPERNQLSFSPSLRLEVPIKDLSSAATPERETQLKQAKKDESNKLFDLLNGPLVRATLFRLEHERHALIFTSHHIVCDGWSTNVLLDELGKLYSARIRGTNPKLEVPAQFSDYALQKSKDTANQDTADAAAYWVKEFETLPPVLDLPADRPRPALKSFQGATYRAQIDVATYKQIKTAGAKQGCTLFATLFTGFVSLLYRLTGQSDIAVGIPTAGQSLLDNGNLVGHCVNFLPLRTRIQEGQSVSALLQQTKRALLDAYEHQSYTYGTLIRNLKIRRDPSRLPLVEVQFNLEKVGGHLDFSGLQVEVDPNAKSAVNFDLFLNIVESDKGLLIDCDYNTDLFDPATIARWLGHFETLLKAMAADASQPVDRLPLLSDSERQQMLTTWNNTASDYPLDKCVHQLIEEQTARTPNHVAATFKNQSLTYSELNRRANQLAHYLIKSGVRPGSLVGIALERSIEMLVGLLATWKAGAAYVPLDPAYPRERLSFIMEETSLPVLLTQSKLVPNLPVFDTRLVCLDRDALLIELGPETNPGLNASPEAVAYTIYTSGSTGKPKGVEVTHRNVVNLLFSMRQKPGIESRDRLLAVTTLSFDIAALELFLPLIVGATVILASRETALDPRLLQKLLTDSKATIMQATPATWRLLLESGWAGDPDLKILCGGEALPRQLAEDLLVRGHLWNMYGPTETTIWSATSRVDSGSGPVPIGPPIHNTQFFVLDNRQQPQPIGVPGELYIGGDGVARGYFENSDLTSERFVRNPFSKDATDRLYRTGDLVRYQPDGRMEFLGRLDNQVKVRGFRIELGEIETVLARNPDIRECAVAVQEDASGVKRLAAFLVSDKSEKSSPETLRSWINASLPEYMVPSIFAYVPALPLTPNGKVDRKVLAKLDVAGLPDQKQFVAPCTPTEQQLVAICGEVLHLDAVSVHESLFDLGADSLHFFQIIARAARAGIAITPQQLLRLRTVSAVAAEWDQSAAKKLRPESAAEQIVPVARERYSLAPAAQA